MKWAKWFLVYLNILTQSIAITDSMFNFGNFLTKNALTFDQKEIERKKRYLVGIKFCCASNAAIKNVKIARKKSTFFPKSPFFKRIQNFRKHKVYFQILEVLPHHFDYLFTCLGLIIKLWINYFQHRVEFTKNYENHVNFIFWDPPYGQIMTPNQKFFLPHGVKLFFYLSPQRTIM